MYIAGSLNLHEYCHDKLLINFANHALNESERVSELAVNFKFTLMATVKAHEHEPAREFHVKSFVLSISS